MERIACIKPPSIIGYKKKRLTPHQERTLVKRFQANPHLKGGEKHQLATSINISAAKIAQWLYNKRHTRKEKGLLRKY